MAFWSAYLAWLPGSHKLWPPPRFRDRAATSAHAFRPVGPVGRLETASDERERVQQLRLRNSPTLTASIRLHAAERAPQAHKGLFSMGKITHAKVVIIGSGPAGYTAAIYAARAMLEPTLIQGIQPGGQLTITTDVENYPGFADVIQGPWLMEQMQKQAEHVGTKLVTDHVSKVDLARRPFQHRMRLGRPLSRRQHHHRNRGAGALAGVAVRTEIQGLWRLRLRDLRRLFLSRQGGAGDRRRQHRRRGGAVPHQFRLQGHRRAPARQFPRGKNPAGPPVQESEDFGDLGHRAGGGDRQREPAQGEGGRFFAT